MERKRFHKRQINLAAESTDMTFGPPALSDAKINTPSVTLFQPVVSDAEVARLLSVSPGIRYAASYRPRGLRSERKRIDNGCCVIFVGMHRLRG